MKRIVSLIVMALFIQFVLSVNSPAQNKASGVEKVVVKLQQKVLLSNEQATKVKSIIASYLDGDKSSENLVEAQRKVAALLDEKQKAKYDIIKDDWWAGVNKTNKDKEE